MPGRKATFIELSPKQEKILMEFKSGTHSMLHLKKRAEIILLAASGENNTSIHNTMGLESNTIMRWRNRYAAANMELTTVETETPNKLRATIKAVLSDGQRPGAPATFTDEQVACILALSCEDPATLSLPFSHWTPSLLREEVIKRNIVTSISSMQISRFLKKKGLKTTSGSGVAES